MFRLYKVKGRSLTPDYREGDFVVVRRIRSQSQRINRGDVLIFRHSQYGIMMKRLQVRSVNGTRLMVQGSHPDSIDSRDFGPIDIEDVIGKVVWHIAKPR